VVECEVRGIEYAFPDLRQESTGCYSVEAKVQLVVTRTPVRSAFTAGDKYVLQLTEHYGNAIAFSVTLRDWDLPDFLVPSACFLRAMERPWHTGTEVSVPYKEYSAQKGMYTFKLYEGLIVGISNASKEWNNSPWDCIEVKWDDPSSAADPTARLGPWEVLFPSELSSGMGAQEVARIQAAIEVLKQDYARQQDSLLLPFVQEVDAKKYRRYYAMIHVPMSLERICKRLQSGYYRQVSLPLPLFLLARQL
jgi:hypothetical protein